MFTKNCLSHTLEELEARIDKSATALRKRKDRTAHRRRYNKELGGSKRKYVRKTRKSRLEYLESLPQNKLTPAQKRFVDAFDGDLKSSAKAAKVSYSMGRLYLSAFRFTHVRDAIQERDRYEQKGVVWDRQERQEFWTKMAKTAEKDSDRLRASELLGKSEADFTDKKIISGSVQTSGIEIVLVKAPQQSNKEEDNKEGEETNE